MTGETGIDGTNVEDVSRAERIARKRLQQALGVFQKYMPGFENAYFTTTASTLGVRETRRIVGTHILNKDDVSVTASGMTRFVVIMHRLQFILLMERTLTLLI